MDEISFWNLLEVFLECFYISSAYSNLFYVCQSFNCLTLLLKYAKVLMYDICFYVIFFETFLIYLHISCNLMQIYCRCVGLFVTLHPHWYKLILQFFKFLTRHLSEIYLRYSWDICTLWVCKKLGMSVSLLVGILPYLSPAKIAIARVLDEIYYWTFKETFLGC